MFANTLLKGLAVGAGAMYFFDPQLGRRRRKLMVDQFHHAMCELNDACDVTWRDATNRLQGCMAELRSSMRPHDNSDEVVHDRVRSKVGRYVSHPAAVHVAVREGHVTLSGPILTGEAEGLVSCVKSIVGVRGVENRLEPHTTAGNISALQGGRHRRGESIDLLQSNWSPTTRCMVGTLGGMMLLSSANSRGLMSLVKGAGAAWLIASAMRQPQTSSRASNAGQLGNGRHKQHEGQGSERRADQQPSEPAPSAEHGSASELQARSGPT